MLDRARWYARPRAAAHALLALGLLALTNVAQARGPVFVQLPADLPAAAAAQLLSALEAQLGDLAAITTQPGAADALCAVEITQAQDGLLIEFAGAPGSAPRLVAGAGELAASQVASIVRAFVVARLEGAEAPGDALEAPQPA